MNRLRDEEINRILDLLDESDIDLSDDEALHPGREFPNPKSLSHLMEHSDIDMPTQTLIEPCILIY